MLVPLTGLVFGILLTEVGINSLCGFTCLGVSIALYIAFFILNKNPLKAYRMRNWHQMWICGLFIGCGIILSDFNRPNNLSEQQLKDIRFAIGTIREISYTTSGDKAIVSLHSIITKDGKHSVIPTVKILLSKPDLGAYVDDNIIFPASLQPISDSPNHFTSGYARRMKQKGILYRVSFDTDNVVVLSTSPTLKGWLMNLRHGIEEDIEKSGLSHDTQAFLITLLLGDRSYLQSDVRQSFADAGISHVLALSGMHVSIIAGILLFLLFPLNLKGWYRARYALVVPLIWGYTLITGCAPSTMRAALMTTCMIICLLSERKPWPWNSLLLATFIILLVDPNALYDVGLQLSFVCVASLLLFVNPINTINKHRNPKLYYICCIVATSLTATFGSWAITSYYFSTLPTLFLPANALVLPMLPFYVVGALVYLCLASMGWKLSLLGTILDESYHWLMQLISFITNDGATIVNLQISEITLLLWYAALVILAIRIYHLKSKVLTAGVIVLFVMAIASVPLNMPGESNTGFIIQTYNDRPSIMIRENGKVIESRFKSNSISQLVIKDLTIMSADCDINCIKSRQNADYLILTQSCTNNLDEILTHVTPGIVVIHPSVRKNREEKLLHKADSLNIPIHSLRKSGALRVDL